MSKIIRIGTSDSQLNLWQANAVQQMLEKLGHETLIVPIKATVDITQMIVNKTIDISVHALINVPLVLPKGIVQAAVIKRGNFKDLLVFKNNEEFLSQKDAVIAVENSRCRAQWLNRYPSHTVVNLSGNLNDRLQKLEDNEEWNGAIFSAANLGRLGLKPEDSINLDWMIPAPARCNNDYSFRRK